MGKRDKVCADCIHYAACQSWNIGTLETTEAKGCKNYEEARAYYLGKKEAEQCADSCEH